MNTKRRLLWKACVMILYCVMLFIKKIKSLYLPSDSFSCQAMNRSCNFYKFRFLRLLPAVRQVNLYVDIFTMLVIVKMFSLKAGNIIKNNISASIFPMNSNFRPSSAAFSMPLLCFYIGFNQHEIKRNIRLFCTL